MQVGTVFEEILYGAKLTNIVLTVFQNGLIEIYTFETKRTVTVHQSAFRTTNIIYNPLGYYNPE